MLFVYCDALGKKSNLRPWLLHCIFIRKSQKHWGKCPTPFGMLCAMSEFFQVRNQSLSSVFVVTSWSPFLFLMSLCSYLTQSDTAVKQNLNYVIAFSFLETYRNAPPLYFVRCPNIVMHSLDYVDLSAEKRYFKHQQVSFGFWKMKMVFLKNLHWSAGWWSWWCLLRYDHWPISRRSIGWRSVVIRRFWREKESTGLTWNRFRTKDPSMPLLLVYGNFIATAQRCQTQRESECGECDIPSVCWPVDVIWCGFVLLMFSKQLNSVPFSDAISQNLPCRQLNG